MKPFLKKGLVFVLVSANSSIELDTGVKFASEKRKRYEENMLNKWYSILPLSQQNTGKKCLAMTKSHKGSCHDPICVHHSFEVLHHKSDEEQLWRSVSSLLYSKRFLYGYSGFPFSLKTNTSNKFQFDLERTDTFQRALN